MQVEMIAADRLMMPTCGPGGLTRERAVAEVQALLDRAAELGPLFAGAAGGWRGAKGDTVYADPFIWTVYEYDDGEGGWRRGALTRLEDLAATMRASTGMDVRVPRLP
jgi:hypothetical protein